MQRSLHAQRHQALGVNIFREDAIEIFFNKFNVLDRMVHGDASLGWNSQSASFVHEI
jgi:hypothetical protein